MFTINKNANLAGTHRVDTLCVSPQALANAFPDGACSGDDYKVDREYVFENEDGCFVFAVYAYKATNLYDSDEPSPKEFWDRTETFEFSVGGRSSQGVVAFKNWIEAEILRVK